MENQDQHIPEHLQLKFEESVRELARTSLQLVEANREYREAILARLALNRELKNWQMKEYYGIDNYIE